MGTNFASVSLPRHILIIRIKLILGRLTCFDMKNNVPKFFLLICFRDIKTHFSEGRHLEIFC